MPDHVTDALKAAVAIRTGAGCQNVVTTPQKAVIPLAALPVSVLDEFAR